MTNAFWKSIMSVASILKNIYSFIEIVESAKSSRVQTWDETAMQNAIQWARYCEQVSSQSDGKPYRSSLDHQVRLMNQLPLALGDAEINLEWLKRATDELRKALLQNIHLSDHLFSVVMTTYGNHEEGRSSFIKECFHISQSHVHLKSFQEIETMLQDTSATTNNKPGVQTENKDSVTAQAVLLWRFIKKNLKNGKRKERSEVHLADILKSIATDENGMTIILSTLLVSEKDKNEDRESCTYRQFILQWVLSNCKQSELHASAAINTRSVWSSPPSLLCDVSAVYFSFFQAYIQYLVSWGNQMSVEYTDTGQGYHWRGPLNQANSAFDDLLAHFRGLSESKKHLSAAVRKVLEGLGNSDEECSVWKHILQKIKT